MSEAITFTDLRFYHTGFPFLAIGLDSTNKTIKRFIISYQRSQAFISQQIISHFACEQEGTEEPWLNHAS